MKNTDEQEQPQTIKDVLSRDYHIPGITPRFYAPVGLFIGAAMALFVWHFWWYTWDNIFLLGVLLLLLISSSAVAVQRVVDRLWRYWR